MTTLTLTWTADADPAVGWNLYLKHFSTPNALAYEGTLGASAREAVLHNIQTGLYEVGLSRVEQFDDNGVLRPLEGPVSVMAINVPSEEPTESQSPIPVPDAPVLTGLTIDFNAS